MASWISLVLSLLMMQSRMNGRRDHDLDGGHAAVAVGARHEAHGDDGLQDARELQADLLLLVGREDGDDAVDGLGGVQGVEGREHQVAGLGRGDGGLDRLVVAHLTDQDHVGVLAQGGAQRRREGARVHLDLALVHDRLLVAVQELDRVLDGDDVLAALGVDVVDHRRERRGLARAGGARAEDQAALLLRDLLEDDGQAQLADGHDLDRDDAEHEADRAALLEHVAAEAARGRAPSRRCRSRGCP